MKHLRRLTALLLCLLLSCSAALADGMRFRLQAEADPAAYPAELQPLMTGLSLLLDACCLEGSLTTSSSSFALDASLHTGSGSAACVTDFQVYGLDSHWGVRSSLLGDRELMVNCAALLPFGQKARDHLGLPLDAAALLVPYTHVAALSSAKELLAPLFPEENGKTRIPRRELDGLVNELLRLCDEDAALNRYLEITGLYGTVKRFGEYYFSIPETLLSSLTVRKDDDELIWSSSLVNILRYDVFPDGVSLDFGLPVGVSVSASITTAGHQLSGEAHASLGSVSLDASFTLHAKLTSEGGRIEVALQASSPAFPADGLALRLEGETRGNAITLRQIDPSTQNVLLTITGTLIPFSSDDLPAYTPADLTGVNILSVNGDSLHALLDDVKWPLMEGVLAFVAAAPAPAVQTLMDYAEDSGLLDLLTDAISGTTY